jgi:hypothetical protein
MRNASIKDTIEKAAKDLKKIETGSHSIFSHHIARAVRKKKIMLLLEQTADAQRHFADMASKHSGAPDLRGVYHYCLNAQGAVAYLTDQTSRLFHESRVKSETAEGEMVRALASAGRSLRRLNEEVLEAIAGKETDREPSEVRRDH